MPAFQLRYEDLPPEIAVFPLSGALLLPGGKLPLNIFEPRYLAMIEASVANRRVFGMVQAEDGKPEGATGPAVYRVGCLGRISSFSETDDGRFLITLTGLIRFRIAEELPLSPGGFRIVCPDYEPYRADLEMASQAPHVDRGAMLGALRGFFRARGIQANWDAIEKTDDALLVTSLSMVCPFAIAEKQALLEAGTADERATMLTSLLEMGARAPDLPTERPN